MKNEFQLVSTPGVCDHSCTKTNQSPPGFCALSPIAPHTHHCNPRHGDNRCKICRQQHRLHKTRTRIHIRKGNQQSRRVACRQQPSARRRQKRKKTRLSCLFFISFFFFQEMEPMIKQTLVCETEAEVKRAQTVSTCSQTLQRAFNEHHTSPRWRESLAKQICTVETSVWLIIQTVL